MRILVFQHVDCEHPGSLRQFLAEDANEMVKFIKEHYDNLDILVAAYEIEWDPVYLL